MVKYREILRQHAMGISKRNIAYSCRCSPTTVVNVIRKATAAALSWPLPEEMNDRAIKDVIYPSNQKEDRTKAQIDHEFIDKEMNRPGVTMMLLWSEYCEQTLASGNEPYMYSAFCEKHRRWANKTKAVMHLEHKPGYEMQLDYVGDTAEVLDIDTGEVYKVYIFVACLPYSNKIFACGAFDMKASSWIACHVEAFGYFGGVATILAPDNLKAGVVKNTLDELILNDQYRTMAEYYGTVVIPARPAKPRDKAAVESAVNLIETKALAPMRNRVFFSLKEFNDALLAKVNEINAKPFQKREGSRDEVFYGQEKASLIPLPAKPFEPVARKVATVNFTYHVTFDGQWYSVPFTYVKREVEICATKSCVWVNCDGCRIATHKRMYGPRGGYSTNIEHMPDTHKDYAGWNGNRFRSWAEKIGPSCVDVINSMLESKPIEQQAYRTCRALLGLESKYGSDLLEQACAKALSYSASPAYKTVKSLIQSIGDTASNPNDGAYLRGSDYYNDIF